MMILIIDDNGDTRAIARMSLEIPGGVETIDAASGPDRVAKAFRAHPGIILLDLEMPNMTGIATLSVLRSNSSTQFIPIIFFAPETKPPAFQEWTQLGVIGVVTKPFDPNQLAQKVHHIIKKFRPPKRNNAGLPM
jgi:CheY-like chemotaxis protein